MTSKTKSSAATHVPSYDGKLFFWRGLNGTIEASSLGWSAGGCFSRFDVDGKNEIVRFFLANTIHSGNCNTGEVVGWRYIDSRNRVIITVLND